MSAAFDFDLPSYVYFGGYPGAAPLVREQARWRAYVTGSVVEPNIERDVLAMERVDKPALLKRLFALGAEYSGQILSYTKMLGQLHDAGNTTTLARYLDLLATAGLVAGLPNYAGSAYRRRASTPKLNVLDTALMSAHSGYTFEEARADRSFWGRLVESAVGAHLLNSGAPEVRLHYWRHRNREVDFVLARGPAARCRGGQERWAAGRARAGSKSSAGSSAAQLPSSSARAGPRLRSSCPRRRGNGSRNRDRLRTAHLHRDQRGRLVERGPDAGRVVPSAGPADGPAGKIGPAVSHPPQSLEDFREREACVLLGAPGAGKTVEFKREADECEDGYYVTARNFITFTDRPEWPGTTLFIDGLDEMRAGAADGRTPLDAIRAKLDALGRPHFRLSCREADWFGVNDRRHLESVSAGGKVTVLRLDPLSGEGIRELLGHPLRRRRRGCKFVTEARRAGDRYPAREPAEPSDARGGSGGRDVAENQDGDIRAGVREAGPRAELGAPVREPGPSRDTRAAEGGRVPFCHPAPDRRRGLRGTRRRVR